MITHMDNGRLQNKRIDLVLDLNTIHTVKSLQPGVLQLKDEGAIVRPRLILANGKTEAAGGSSGSTTDCGKHGGGHCGECGSEKCQNCGPLSLEQFTMNFATNVSEIILELLDMEKEKLVSEIVTEDRFCHLYQATADFIFVVTGGSLFLEELYQYLEYTCSCPADNGRFAHPPVVIALNPGNHPQELSQTISKLLHLPGVFWVPFGWLYTTTHQLHLFTRVDLWSETCVLAKYNKQIQPFFIEVPGSGYTC